MSAIPTTTKLGPDQASLRDLIRRDPHRGLQLPAWLDRWVSVGIVSADPQVARRLNQNLMLYYTNVSRTAESVLSEQRQNTCDRMDVLQEMKS